MKTKSFITIFLVLLMKFGDAQSWVYVTKGADDVNIYIRSNPVSLQNTIKIWIKTEEGGIITDKTGDQVNNPGGNTLFLVEFDCLNQEYRIHSFVFLDSNGNIVDIIDLNGYRTPFSPIIPNSVFEKVSKKVCEPYN